MWLSNFEKIQPKKTLQENIFHDYTDGKQSCAQLAKSYNLSIKTVRSRIGSYKITLPIYEPGKTVIIMGTFYFRRNYGVMVFWDAYLKRNLFRQYVKYETIALLKNHPGLKMDRKIKITDHFLTK